jgi:hypothetical protein
MTEITFEPMKGVSIHQACREAVNMCRDNGVPVRFDFNGITMKATLDSTATKMCEDYWEKSRALVEEARVNAENNQKLVDIKRLQEICARLPNVEESFMLEVASMSREELQRRVLVQADWHGCYASCLDGLPIPPTIGGTGIDRYRDPRQIRRVVEYYIKLTAPKPVPSGLAESPRPIGDTHAGTPTTAAEPGTAAPSAEAGATAP